MRSAKRKHGLPMAEIQLPSPRRRGLHIVHADFFIKSQRSFIPSLLLCAKSRVRADEALVNAGF